MTDTIRRGTGTTDDLDVARQLAEHGIPIFVAYPDPTKKLGYRLPGKWEQTTPNPAYVNAWKPGLALCAVMGRGLDLVDVDPRNGGDKKTLNGSMPRVYGEATTPSGGWHGFVKSLGVHSCDDVLPGIDVKAGTDGHGHGFAFIAPTVRPSKITGEPVPYQWTWPPDLTALHETGDDSGQQLAALIRNKRGKTTTGDGGEGGSSFLQTPPWADLPGTLANNTRHVAVHKLASALRGRGGWRYDDALETMRDRVWPLIDQKRGGHPYTASEFEADIRDVFNRYKDGHDDADGLWAARTADEPPEDPGEPSPPDDNNPELDIEYERRARHALRVAEELEKLRIREEARHQLTLERYARQGPPEILTLRERLSRPRTATQWRIQDWQPTGTRVVLAAQFKAGKTTLRDNLVRSLVDEADWLGRYDVTPVNGAVAVLDFEMGANQLDDWLREQRISNDDRILVVPLRGRVTAFDLLDHRTLMEWAGLLRQHGVAYLLLDCLRPILDAFGLDENHDAGRFLVALDQLLAEANIPDCLVVHHMGHTGERSRGDSRIRDWPDVEWRLVRETDEPHSTRFISAYGRDVDQYESALAYAPSTRHLTLEGGSRVQQKAQRALRDVLAVLDEQDEPWTGRRIEAELAETDHSRKTIRDAIKLGIRLQAIVVQPGPKNSILHSRPPSSAPVRRSAPEVRQRTGDECASAPIGGALTHAPDPHPSAPLADPGHAGEGRLL